MREEGTWCGAAPSACRGCRAPSWAGRAAGRAPAAGGSEGEAGSEDACTPRRPGRGRQAWLFALAEMPKKLRANRGKASGLRSWKCVVSAAADDGDADAGPPCHCRGDDPSRSLGAGTASHCCRGGGERAAQTAATFPV